MSATITTAVIQAASSYDLTDLATVKDELSIKPNDTSIDNFLKRGISQKSAAIANYCNRVFVVEGVVDTISILYEPGDPQATASNRIVQLSRFPVVAIKSLTQNGNTLVEGVDFRVDYDSGQVYRLATNGLWLKSWHSSTVVIDYLGGYFRNATQAATVPANPGPYTVTVTNATTLVFDRGIKYSNGTALAPVSGSPAQGQYSQSAGVYTFNTLDAGASVSIAYAYQKIPDDIIDAALQLVTMRYRAKGRDPMLMSHSEPQIGEDRWWVGGGPAGSTFTPEIDAMLDSYRVPVFA